MPGTRFRTASRAQLRARATPPSGSGPESIWTQWYDTQNFANGSAAPLAFFTNVQNDRTLSNMKAQGMLVTPEWLTLYDITADYEVSLSSVVNVNQSLGILDDLQRILLVSRATWTFNMSDKDYGPYSLTTLHGTGGAVGFMSPGNTAATGNAQYAMNTIAPGWNYYGSLIIPPQTGFRFRVDIGVAPVLNTTPIPCRVSFFGIGSRRVL